jgi:hypothetical protein
MLKTKRLGKINLYGQKSHEIYISLQLLMYYLIRKYISSGPNCNDMRMFSEQLVEDRTMVFPFSILMEIQFY